MKRLFTGFAIACGCAVMIHAQETTTTTKTEVSGQKAQTMTYTGCLQTAPETKGYILAKGIPVGQTTSTEVGTSGTTTSTTTTYALVPGERIEFQQHVGHKVEVTGMMIPAGDSKVKTTTKTEREDAADSKTKETIKSDNAMPQFRVTSIKTTAETC
jgi:hypothetical protein